MQISDMSEASSNSRVLLLRKCPMTYISSGEGRVGLVCRVLSEVVEQLTEDSPAQQEGGEGVDQGGHRGEGYLLPQGDVKLSGTFNDKARTFSIYSRSDSMNT